MRGSTTVYEGGQQPNCMHVNLFSSANQTKSWTVCRLHGLHAVVLVLSARKSYVNHTKRWTVCRLHGLHAVVLVLSACKSDCL